jgi:hypothetical protein
MRCSQRNADRLGQAAKPGRRLWKWLVRVGTCAGHRALAWREPGAASPGVRQTPQTWAGWLGIPSSRPSRESLSKQSPARASGSEAPTLS